MRQVRNETALDRIGCLCKYDGYRLGDLHQRRHSWVCVSKDDIGRKSNQLSARGTSAFRISISKTIINVNVAAFGPTEFFKALLECGEESLRFGIGLEWDQHADPPDGSPRCPNAASGRLATALLISVMNSRRRIVGPEAQDRTSYQSLQGLRKWAG